MVTGWIVSSVIPFAVFYTAVYLVWRRGALKRADFGARRESARLLGEYLGIGFGIVLFGTLVLVFVTGFGASLSTLASESATIRGLLPPYVLRWGVVVYGPLLAGILLVYDAVAPHLDALHRRTLTRRESIRTFTNGYVALTLPFFGLLVIVHWAPAGIGAGITAAVAVMGYHAADPYKISLLFDVREPTGEERKRFEGVAGPHDVSVRVLEAANARYAMGFAAGFVPGHRTVFLTDYLVDALSERELRAVLAHEYAHLRAQSTLRTTAIKATCFGVGAWALTAELRIGFALGPLFDTFVIGSVIVGAYLSGVRQFSKNEEFRVDRFAAEQVGSTDLARALVRIMELNDPEMSGDPRKLIADSQPEIEERIRRLRPELLWSTPPIPTRA